MSPRARLIAVAGALLAVLVAALVLWARSLLAPERFTAMLVQGVADAGLELHLDAPAHPALWPHPAVEIDGLRLSLPGQYGDALLTARKLRLVVPWRALLRRETRIERLEVHSPRIDLAAFRPWLETRPAQVGAVAPRLPAIDVGVDIDGGTLYDGDALLLEDVTLQTGMLRNGEPFELTLRARDARARPVAFDLAARPQAADGIRLDPFRLGLGLRDDTELVLQGDLDWRGGARLAGNATGTLRRGEREFALELGMQSADTVSLRLEGAGTHLALTLAPMDAWHWWQDTFDARASQLALPPVEGDGEAGALAWRGWSVQGLRVTSGPAAASSAAPAAAATVPAPAAVTP